MAQIVQMLALPIFLYWFYYETSVRSLTFLFLLSMSSELSVRWATFRLGLRIVRGPQWAPPALRLTIHHCYCHHHDSIHFFHFLRVIIAEARQFVELHRLQRLLLCLIRSLLLEWLVTDRCHRRSGLHLLGSSEWSRLGFLSWGALDLAQWMAFLLRLFCDLIVRHYHSHWLTIPIFSPLEWELMKVCFEYLSSLSLDYHHYALPLHDDQRLLVSWNHWRCVVRPRSPPSGSNSHCFVFLHKRYYLWLYPSAGLCRFLWFSNFNYWYVLLRCNFRETAFSAGSYHL